MDPLAVSLDDELAKIRSDEDHDLTNDVEDCDDDHEEVPDPDDQVDLLVEDVDGQVTHPVHILDISRGSEVVHGALDN